MYFNSIDFAIFFPLVFILYWVFFKNNRNARNIFLISASYFFYSYWDWRFLSLIIISSLVDYIVGKRLFLQDNRKKRKLLLIVSIVVNFGFLGFFKYFNFFVDNFVATFTFFGLQPEPHTLNIILPVGISFYTFQTLSYTIDIYHSKIEPTNDALSFFAFVSFFPQLVAGPIERAKQLLPQFEKAKNLDYEKLRYGILLIASGLFKKILLADRLAIYINRVYGDIDQVNGLPAMFAVLFFAFQLYFDFSGYSEIAKGSAKMLDFDLMDNFRRPYLASSFTDFWKRWHISLSTWFRDYLYVPLGGNRINSRRTIINILIVFALSGLWHGASWNFIIWGILNALFLILFDKLIFKIKSKKPIQVTLFRIFVFSSWAISLIFFRGQTFQDAISMFKRLGFNNAEELFNFGFSVSEFYFTICLLVIIILYEIIQEKTENLYGWFTSRKKIVRWSLYLTMVILIIFFGAYGEGMSDNQFIYFQF
jgi:alginate O-acetyltransferase complex protein AlgI